MKYKYFTILGTSFIILGGGILGLELNKNKNVQSYDNTYVEVSNDDSNTSFILEDNEENNLTVNKRYINTNTYELEATVTPTNQTEDFIWSTSHENLVSIETYDNKCVVTKINDFRGYVVINLKVGELTWNTKVFTKPTYEFKKLTVTSPGLKKTNKGYYSLVETQIAVSFEYVSNIVTTSEEAYLKLSDYFTIETDVDYSIDSLIRVMPQDLIDEIESYNLPFMHYGDLYGYTYSKDSKSVKGSFTIVIDKTKDGTYTNPFFSMNFIEYIAPTSLNVNNTELYV